MADIVNGYIYDHGRKLNMKEPGKEGGPCLVCGKPATAIWMCKKNILVCAYCAIEVLPSLIADAIPKDAVRNYIEASLIWRKASARYFECLCARLGRMNSQHAGKGGQPRASSPWRQHR